MCSFSCTLFHSTDTPSFLKNADKAQCQVHNAGVFRKIIKEYLLLELLTFIFINVTIAYFGCTTTKPSYLMQYYVSFPYAHLMFWTCICTLSMIACGKSTKHCNSCFVEPSMSKNENLILKFILILIILYFISFLCVCFCFDYDV